MLRHLEGTNTSMFKKRIKHNIKQSLFKVLSNTSFETFYNCNYIESERK